MQCWETLKPPGSTEQRKTGDENKRSTINWRRRRRRGSSTTAFWVCCSTGDCGMSSLCFFTVNFTWRTCEIRNWNLIRWRQEMEKYSRNEEGTTTFVVGSLCLYGMWTPAQFWVDPKKASSWPKFRAQVFVKIVLLWFDFAIGFWITVCFV